MRPSQTLTPEDLQRLEALLGRDDFHDNTLSLEALDGFLTALILCPTVVMPSEYLPEIFGGEMPVWDSLDQVQDAMRLIQGLWNLIVERLDIDLEDPAGYAAALPLLGWPQNRHTQDKGDGGTEAGDLLADVPEGFPLAMLWSLGFLRGYGLRAEAWTQWLGAQPQIADTFNAILGLVVVELPGEKDMPLPEGVEPYSHQDRIEVVASLPARLQEANDLRMQAGPKLPPTRTVRKPPKVGRNDPCPCGSGRKYKRCCGAH